MNEIAFDVQWFERLKPQLTSFCYRMLGSADDADDVVQETYIRAWQSWSSFRQQSSPQTWIYRIASNACLDRLRQAKRRVLPVDFSDPAASIIAPRETLTESSWVWPAPDADGNPEDQAVRKETLRLCFIALLQTLPPRQRAALILKDVFEWSAKEIADTLGTSPAAINSALQRARETMDRAQLRSGELSSMDSHPDHELLARYVEAFEQFDVQALVALFHEDGCMSMPPFPMWIRGQDDLSKFFTLTRGHCEGSKFIPVTCNGGYPALAQYMPSQDPAVLVPWGIHVIEAKDTRILHVQNFINTELFTRFGLPAHIDR